MTDEETKAMRDCVGALQFILAFYEPGQRHLDTEAWKVACTRAVAAYHQAGKLIDWPVIPLVAQGGAVYREETK